MNSNALPQHVIEEDNRLEKETAEKLGYLRWHWTLDESNPGRVTQVEYAKAVGVGRTTIQKYVAAYVEKMSDASDTPWSKIIDRKAMGSEAQAATEALTDASGNSFSTERGNRPTSARSGTSRRSEPRTRVRASIS